MITRLVMNSGPTVCILLTQYTSFPGSVLKAADTNVLDSALLESTTGIQAILSPGLQSRHAATSFESWIRKIKGLSEPLAANSSVFFNRFL